MMKFFLFISFAMFCLFSCGHKTSKPDSELKKLGSISLGEVDLEKSKTEKGLLQVDTGESDLIQGSFKNNNTQTLKVPVVALILGPGLNRTSAHAVLLRVLKNKDVPIRIISGVGLGAVIASLYAFGTTPEIIEWRLYQFFSQTKEVEPYSEEWKEILRKVLLTDLADKEIQASLVPLLIPVYDNKLRKVQYFSRGKLLPLLEGNLTIVPRENLYSTPMAWRVFDRPSIVGVGGDIILASNVLNPLDNFEGLRKDYLQGVFGRAISKSKKDQKQMDFLIDFPDSDPGINLDKGMPYFLQKSSLRADRSADEILELIKNWQLANNEKK